jgi:hypothetical protein
MGKRRKGTPDDLDYLFKRDIIDEEDYADFWESYWKATTQRDKQSIVDRYVEIAAESGQPVVGVVSRNRLDAERQAQSLNDLGDVAYRVVRRNAKGQFNKRGTYWQAIRK